MSESFKRSVSRFNGSSRAMLGRDLTPHINAPNREANANRSSRGHLRLRIQVPVRPMDRFVFS